jgi:GGDEF domain-containing protein
MPKFIEALTATDFENLFKHMHASIALIDKHGNVLTANQNFETHKEFIQNKLPKKLTEMHWVEKLPVTDTEQSHLDCFLIPASDERFILLADPVNVDPASKTQIESLQKQVKMFQIESEVSKKIARNKQIELDAVVEQAKEVAEIDALTYIYNRRAIIRELQSEVLRAERYQSALSISIIDVDHFKKINDTHGHMVGDGVLKEVAILLRDGIRSPDVVGRGMAVKNF